MSNVLQAGVWTWLTQQPTGCLAPWFELHAGQPRLHIGAVQHQPFCYPQCALWR